MDFQVSTSTFAAALSQVSDIAADKKGAMPILSCALLNAEQTPEGGRLTISTYDLEMGMSIQLPCEIKQEGKVALPAKKLLEVVKALPSNVTHFKQGANNRMEILSGESAFRLAGMSADDFPALPVVQDTEYMPTSFLQGALAKVAFAMSHDETRYNLNGVYLDLPAGKAVATDGHRMALADLDTVDAPAVIISKKAVIKLRKLLSATDDRGEFSVNESSLLYRRSGLRLVSRLVDGQFPAYTQVTPERSKNPVLVERAALREALSRVMLMAADSASSVQLTFAGNVLAITARNPDEGDASDVVKLASEAPAQKLNLNGHYLMDMLHATDAKMVEVHLGDETSPVLVTPEGDNSHTYVLMPMRS